MKKIFIFLLVVLVFIFSGCATILNNGLPKSTDSGIVKQAKTLAIVSDIVMIGALTAGGIASSKNPDAKTWPYTVTFWGGFLGGTWACVINPAYETSTNSTPPPYNTNTELQIGMSIYRVTYILGEPDSNNEDVYSWGTRNQLVYRNQRYQGKTYDVIYLYFEDNYLISWSFRN